MLDRANSEIQHPRRCPALRQEGAASDSWGLALPGIWGVEVQKRLKTEQLARPCLRAMQWYGCSLVWLRGDLSLDVHMGS